MTTRRALAILTALGATFVASACSADSIYERDDVDVAAVADDAPDGVAAGDAKSAPAVGAEAADALRAANASRDAGVRQIQLFIAEQEIDTSARAWRTRLPKPPQVPLAADATYSWILDTNVGRITIRLLQDAAPMHVANVIYLTELGYYDDLSFHRVIRDFMAQGGCPLGSGAGNPGYQLDLEISPTARHDRRGVLSTANSGPNTDGSQFFLTFKATPFLDDSYTVFGVVSDGMDAVDALESAGAASDPGRPSRPLRIDKASIAVD